MISTTTETSAPEITDDGIEITYVDGCELYCRYSGQTEAQPCYVSLDCESGALSAGYNPEIGNAVPAREYHGHVQAWSIPCLREEPANALLDAIRPLAARVVAGYVSEWDGSSNVAVFDEDAQEAIDAIGALCEQCDASDTVRVWDAGDWLTACGQTSRDQLRAELKITATTTDEELGALESRLDAEGGDEVDVLEGLGRYLRGLRDEARNAADEG